MSSRRAGALPSDTTAERDPGATSGDGELSGAAGRFCADAGVVAPVIGPVAGAGTGPPGPQPAGQGGRWSKTSTTSASAPAAAGGGGTGTAVSAARASSAEANRSPGSAATSRPITPASGPAGARTGSSPGRRPVSSSISTTPAA